MHSRNYWGKQQREKKAIATHTVNSKVNTPHKTKLYELEHSLRLMSPTEIILLINQALLKYFEDNMCKEFG